MLVAPAALAADDDGSESCGNYEISVDALCELLDGDECESQCEDTDMNSQSEETCSEECGGGIGALLCLATCIPEVLLELQSGCSDGCSGDGSLFCDESYLHLDDVSLCVDQLCSLGLNMGEVCE